ncbi:hypothetical protein PAT3040_06904 [Paenibacillus agaridevorans]|uniref:Nucleotidyl transferase AbiEii/AbiGii toxin family protein n=1 Tax=Paenibacillus agaridevorans TaxID=171404 RepID=A0A2R5F5G2_9BACL|nr:hypothetical protein [Paenibacillus agaridevorans]GBG12043.1 hypothetical protein PAT3040_06904 [Paenibacillus agaridevorans]
MTEKAEIKKALAAIIRLAGNEKWVVGGSAGLLLRGLSLPAKPRDLDLYCDEEDSQELHERLRPFAVDEAAYSETAIYRSTLSHYELEGVRVELVSGFHVSAFQCSYWTEVRQVLIPNGFPVMVEEGLPAAVVVPLAHELWFNALRGRPDRVRMITEAYAANPTRHQGALAVIEDRNTFSPLAIGEVHGWLGQSEAGEEQWMLKSSSGPAASPFV